MKILNSKLPTLEEKEFAEKLKNEILAKEQAKETQANKDKSSDILEKE